MKVIKISISVILVFAVTVLMSFVNQNARAADTENHCFTCHTNPRQLIKITREIAEANKGKVKAAESEGEG
jgi:nitrate/TMAO reductase-like tetraheme cytochrome c subunit